MIKTLGGLASFEKQDIRTQSITESQLESMYRLTGSYDMLFSRRAIKYRELGLKDKSLSEQEIKRYILEDYTFLKRPVVLIDGQIFIGSDAKTVASLKAALEVIY